MCRQEGLGKLQPLSFYLVESGVSALRLVFCGVICSEDEKMKSVGEEDVVKMNNGKELCFNLYGVRTM